MWRYIVESDTGGYVFGDGDASKPLVFVKREDAKRVAKSWAKSLARSLRVVRISTRSALFAALTEPAATAAAGRKGT